MFGAWCLVRPYNNNIRVPIFYKIVPNVLVVCFCFCRFFFCLCYAMCHVPADSLLMREIFYVQFKHNLILFYSLPLHFHCINSNSFLPSPFLSPSPPLLLWFSMRSFCQLLLSLNLCLFNSCNILYNVTRITSFEDEIHAIARFFSASIKNPKKKYTYRSIYRCLQSVQTLQRLYYYKMYEHLYSNQKNNQTQPN